MHEPYVYVAPDNPAIVKNNDLCTSCGHCYAVCEEANGVAGREKVACLNCGQCAAACPEQAITPKNDVPLVEAAVNDPEKIVVFSTSPSVRVGLGDAFGRLDGQYVEDKMVAALRALGGDYVLDVTFSADLTIVEEGTELLSRILDQSGPLPQFTSCCPAWVKYAETFHPEILPNISSAKSPIGMQGALVKTYFAFQNQIDPQNIVHVAVTPCTAKKFEISRPELNAAGAAGCCPQMRDVDYVITTKELAWWMKKKGVDYDALQPSPFDSLLGKGTGAGVIFGNTGGVMEAALRAAYTLLEKKPAPDTLLDFEPVRGLSGIKSAEVTIAGKTIKTAVAFGTANAEKLIESEAFGSFHFIEVMTCPGGCISGAGQPQGHIIPPPDSLRKKRMRSLYREDERLTRRNSLDNPEVQELYREFLKTPGSELARFLLHTRYHAR